MRRKNILEEFGIPVSEWGNCEDMADEIVRLRNITAEDHIDALVAMGAKLTFANPYAIYNGPVLILPMEMTS